MTSDDFQQPSLLHSQEQRDFWSKTLAGAPAKLDLPTDRPRPYHRSTNGSKILILLDAHLTQPLKKLAAEYNMDLSMIVMTGWGAVLARLASQDDIIIGFHHEGLEGPGGNKQANDSNILPLRLDLSGEPSISQLLKRVKKVALSSMDHQGFPLDSIAEVEGLLLPQVVFRWNSPMHLTSSLLVDLELQLQEKDNEVVGEILFSLDLFDPDTIERHVGYLCSMLQATVVDVDQPVMTVDLLSQVERDLVLGQWNETHQDYPSHLCIHHLFEQQAEQNPQATALVFKDQSLTYAELNERANRLAHHLIKLGVQPDSLVAICVERSFAMIVGVLAVLKAGGAYVPLDPSYPKDRLVYILEDAAPTIALADTVGRAALAEACQPLQHQTGIVVS